MIFNQNKFREYKNVDGYQKNGGRLGGKMAVLGEKLHCLGLKGIFSAARWGVAKYISDRYYHM
jgi:hypothetical protein